MLGWDIFAHELPVQLEWEEGSYSRHPILNPSLLVASWSAPLGGIAWLDKLVTEGKAKELAHNGGYPLVYSLTSEDLYSHLEIIGPGEFRSPPIVRELRTSGPIILQAWDQS